MSRPTPFAFFWVVLRPTQGTVAALALFVGGAAWSALRAPDTFDQFCLLALFVQMFVASTGFRHAALRGYFDPVLAAGTSRIACARAHWALSLVPGAVAWLLLAGLAVAFQPVRIPALTSASALVGLLYVTTVCWSATLPFQRYTAGVVWFVTIFVLAAGHQLHTLREPFLAAGGGGRDTLALARGALIAPILLVTNSEAANATTLGLVLGVTAVVWLAGACFIMRWDGVLKDPS